MKKKMLVLLGIVTVCLITFLFLACPEDDPVDNPPTQTTGISADVEELENGDLKITWTKITNALYYEIFEGKSRMTANSSVGETVETTFTVTPKNARKYENYYKIEARDGTGETLQTLYASLELSLFGPRVWFFTPEDSIADIEAEINRIHDTESSGRVIQPDGLRIGEFSIRRYAFFFKPGTYSNHGIFNIGFYTHISGLGRLPTDTVIRGGIATPAHLDTPPNNATCTFWRSIENFHIQNTGSNRFHWGVSQSAPVRRMMVDVQTTYDYGGQASGGFTADSHFNGAVGSASQQQWYTRNSHHTTAMSGVNWNKVVQGMTGADGPTIPTEANYTNAGPTPIIREKPFLFIDNDGEYKVFKPGLRYNASGVSWGAGKENNGMGVGEIIDFVENFYVAKEGKDTAATINAALASGKHIYFSPGRYEISTPIVVKNPNTIILGHGFPTLYPSRTNSHGCIFIDDVSGVTVAGLMFDAAPRANSAYQITAGPTGANADHSANPTLLADLCLRVGGYDIEAVHSDICALINSNNVITDKFWVWRADHPANGGVDWHRNTSKNGVVVFGNDVVAYGLFVEHFHEYNTLWIGDRGRMYFYQNETPYDVHFQRQYMSHNGTVNGWAQYKVDNRVNEHFATGLGMYCVFLIRNNGIKEEIRIANAMEVPNKPGVHVINATLTYIGTGNGPPVPPHPRGGFESIINGVGSPAMNAWAHTSIYEYKDGVYRGSGEVSGSNAQQVGTDAERHWVEELVINSSGIVTANPKGGLTNVPALTVQ